MYITRVLITALLIVWATPALSAQQSAESLYQNARRHYYALFSSPRKMKARKQWRRVINRFKTVVDKHPKSKRGDDALYTIGLLYKRLYFQLGDERDKQAALKSFEGVVKRYPKSNLVDEAQRHIGDIRYRERDEKKAVKAYRKALVRKKIIKTTVSKRPKSRINTGKKQKARGEKIVRRTTPAKARARRDSGRQTLSKLIGVQRFSRNGYTRLILHLSNPTAYKTAKIKNPDRLFIDMLDTGLGPKIPKTTRYSSGMAKSVRIAMNQSKVARVVIDFSEPNTFQTVSALYNPFRLVIDLGRRKMAAKSRPAVKSKRAPPKQRNVRVPSVNVKRSGRVRTIVIDAGHGGKDPGAIGPTGVKEKNVTLAIAKELKKAIEKKMKARVILTRSRDRFVELDNRTVYANSVNADLFISIHANASRNRRARGIETYFLSPARSKDELATAARENMISLGSRDATKNDLAYIMSDLTNTQKVNDSSILARSVQRSLVKGTRRQYHGVKDKGVKQAVFYVLWRASMPSILVETGFITNRSEERRLKNRAYIKTLANSIATGIAQFSRTYMVAQR
ncbi:N-acetylmuramoyl-L-alanine amidase [hydrothermal vent metagenome]|uniref:N-acetylmuramoyl-L-alanine amidase n=1 Tax=hydrothermal vent metagenome TaxID=652676 RepID=A0A3B1D6B4_9ZZZZ